MDLRILYSEMLERMDGLVELTAEDRHAAARDVVLRVLRRRLLERRPVRAVRT